MQDFEELFSLAAALNQVADTGDAAEFLDPLSKVEEAAESVGLSSSGSWLGYHANVYYSGLQPPPPGAHFSQEWGLMDMSVSSLGSRGDWQEFPPTAIAGRVQTLAGNPDLVVPREISARADAAFTSLKAEIELILESELASHSDNFLERLKSDLDRLRLATTSDAIQAFAPKGTTMTRDSIAAGQGNQAPPHLQPLAEVYALRHSIGACRSAAEIATKAASYLERQRKRKRSADRVGTNVFIGHGRSQVWRELKDFVGDRLGLPWDEFNRVPVAGVTNIARLSEMLDAAAVALVVMTAEDEMADGEMQARMNVIHEAGLFQGRLGFTKAILLVEEGCNEFSNVEGLGQIRFPKGNVAAAFEEIRKVLEREGLIEA